MFGRPGRSESPARVCATGHRRVSRSGQPIGHTFSWEDDLDVAAAEARREHRLGHAAPSVIIEPAIVIDSLSVFGVQVLDLADCRPCAPSPGRAIPCGRR
jgi:hypothetical protein